MKKKIKIVLSIFKGYLTYNIGLGILSLLTIIATYISPQVNALLIDRGIGEQKIPIEQNRCAMACQGCGAVLFLLKKQWHYFP